VSIQKSYILATFSCSIKHTFLSVCLSVHSVYSNHHLADLKNRTESMFDFNKVKTPPVITITDFEEDIDPGINIIEITIIFV
jgi:hypothetical protein